MTRRFLVLFVPLVVFSIGLAVALLPTPAADDAPAKPVRLAVVVVFDQLRGDYLTRWDALFAAEGGFHRLEKDGAWFTNCHYPYAVTVTGAGHATLSTGCPPSRHGIIENEWYRHDDLGLVYCATSPERHRVPPPGQLTKKEEEIGFGSPENLEVPTIGDALKAAHHKDATKSRVFSLSLKDRSAVLLGGKSADGCYWLEPKSGAFVTSDYFRDSLPEWVKEFNDGRPADAWFNKDWTPLRCDVDRKYYWPSDKQWAGDGIRQGAAFPHPTTGGLDALGPRYYDALISSPFGNELLLALAKRAIEKEGIGTGDASDLLMLSFSSNDYIGHAWGPDSPEVLDVTLRTDLLLKELLDYLDAKVGKGRYVLVLSADHGVCPLPEVTEARRKADPSCALPEARRLNLDLLYKDAEAFLH
jgi:hypothetical protein